MGACPVRRKNRSTDFAEIAQVRSIEVFHHQGEGKLNDLTEFNNNVPGPDNTVSANAPRSLSVIFCG